MTGPAPAGGRVVHAVLPGGVADPTAPSGGNVYDLRVCRDLPALGWQVHRHPVPGGWPRPDAAATAGLARLLAGLPDGAVVLLDGLVACGVPDVLRPEAARLRLAVLLHLPLADETGLAPQAAAELGARERRALHTVAAVIATSDWAARRIRAHHGPGLPPVTVARPGADPAPLAPGTDGAGGLLCVASVTPRKGHRRLVDALATVADAPWTCTFVGGTGHDPDGSVPGLLVPSDEPAALAGALRAWFGTPDLRRRLAVAARARRAILEGWETTSHSLAGALERLRNGPLSP
ncbi:hypothetical protein [Streptomyces sp. 769]|uniref:hypothetical protein n=1 Tax=Streptomyces sp. 769 TaxID=1262452 RepID=UPI00057C87EF|nr:hypothetical protein [Streptomyces sp. 769]